MNTDIIALAKEAGFAEFQRILNFHEIKNLVALLEAEIRKEFEGVIKAYERDIEKAVAESVKAGIGEHSPEAAIATLAYQRDEAIEQNAKLMEALEGYKNALSKACGDDEESINNTLESVGALTPQPEKDGEEKDPHQDLLDSWGPSA